jgi:hypothetical protein
MIRSFLREFIVTLCNFVVGMVIGCLLLAGAHTLGAL